MTTVFTIVNAASLTENVGRGGDQLFHIVSIKSTKFCSNVAIVSCSESRTSCGFLFVCVLSFLFVLLSFSFSRFINEILT